MSVPVCAVWPSSVHGCTKLHRIMAHYTSMRNARISARQLYFQWWPCPQNFSCVYKARVRSPHSCVCPRCIT